ncbi:MAG: hypothetical protein AAF730_07100 [Bacteroidota bacterium]
MAENLRKRSFPKSIIDPYYPTAGLTDRAAYKLNSKSRMWLICVCVGVAGLAIALVGLVIDKIQHKHEFFPAYLMAWTFCASISVGSIFFVIINHLTKARWSIVIRRIFEGFAFSMPMLAILSIPILLGIHDIYHWSHAELYTPGSPEFDQIIYDKRVYLNAPFFIARVLLYVGLWSYISWRLWTISIKQDVEGDPMAPVELRKLSAWGLAVMAVTTAFASFDLLMSTDPHWYSTIFGIYFFAGAFSTAIALTTFTALLLQKQGESLKGVVSKSHYHDLGKFMFGFTVFWAYIAFSQYMLIWYGNVPEETIWYRHRLEHGWEYLSAALLAFHFIIPFVILISQGAKKIKPLLAIMAIWFVVMQWLDHYWLVAPSTIYYGGKHAAMNIFAVSAAVGMFALYYGVFLYRLGRHSLVPYNDPRFEKSLHFH